MSALAESLLLEIARCPNVDRCRSEANHPCRSIVATQGGGRSSSQVPEPWSGDLLGAPILFISSNPSINEAEWYPRWTEADHALVEFFDGRFEHWIKDGTRSKLEDGSWSRPVPFWREVRGRATELLPYEARPGIDYALTEVVHCKSRAEGGVSRALSECSARWLPRALAASGAQVVVVFGSIARQGVHLGLGLEAPESRRGTVCERCRGRYGLGPKLRVGRRELQTIFLPHPNARMHRRVATWLDRDEINEVRRSLTDNR